MAKGVASPVGVFAFVFDLPEFEGKGCCFPSQSGVFCLEKNILYQHKKVWCRNRNDEGASVVWLAECSEPAGVMGRAGGLL